MSATPSYHEDESELAFVGGLVEAFRQGIGPQSLECITVEGNHELTKIPIKPQLHRKAG